MRIRVLEDSAGKNLIKLPSNVFFSLFVFSVIVFTLLAVFYQPPDPWMETSPPLSGFFTEFENTTLKNDDSMIRTGEDLPNSGKIEEKQRNMTESPNIPLPLNCHTSDAVNCTDPRVLIAVENFNLKVFKSIVFLKYDAAVNGSRPNECDVSWRFRNKMERSRRKYRDFRRFELSVGPDCSHSVKRAGKWHSGTNARNSNTGMSASLRRIPPHIQDTEINDSTPVLDSDEAFKNRKYLYYSRGGDSCKEMNQYLWSLLCGLGEAEYLNRTYVMDLEICLANKKDDAAGEKDFRFYFDFEHLKQTVPIVEETEFFRKWRYWEKTHMRKLSIRKVPTYKITPVELQKDRNTILWRKFEGPEPENYWYRVCEGGAGKKIQRPWHALWKSKRLMNMVTEISGKMDWDFDAVHVVRGEAAMNKELWPSLDSDTRPGALFSKLESMVKPWRHLYIATNEAFYDYFDKMRSRWRVHLLEDYKEMWGKHSEWYNETMDLNGGRPVEFDGYMRAAVDTEVLYRAKTRVETFNNLTSDCKDGVGRC